MKSKISTSYTNKNYIVLFKLKGVIKMNEIIEIEEFKTKIIFKKVCYYQVYKNLRSKNATANSN